jgi:lysine 6-dehydrogenase
VRDADLVVGAVPGYLGYATLRTVISSGKDVVDISFFNEDPFTLHELAVNQGVTAIMDCGVAPGLSNLILGYHYPRMAVASFHCLVGGLPVRRSWPYEYKAPFSPIDVLEEYTRPARVMEHGQIVIKPALSDSEYVEIEPVGTLEAFNTDGLRTLLETLPVPDMVEKTLRYPGHIGLMRALRESGFFGKDAIQVGTALVRPLDVTAALLFRQWQLEPGEPEFTAMQVTVRGREDGQPKEYVYQLFDRTDPQTGTSSMARTTGYTCTAVARLLLAGQFNHPGVYAPETVGATEDCFERVLTDLRAHRVIVTRSERNSME